MIYNINNRKMEFDNVNGIHLLPTLYNRDKMGRLNKWTIYVSNNSIASYSQIDEGVIKRFKPVCCKGKNIGKKNETSDEEQALFECYSKWLKKQDQGYTKDIPKELSKDTKKDEKTTLLPMLANKYQDRKKYLQIPFAVSRKLDGIRMITKQEDNKIICLSRLGKEFCFMEHIRTQILSVMTKLNWMNINFDGELYSHDLSFNQISSIVRQKNKPSKDEDKLQYWIFDVADTNATYKERVYFLKVFKETYEKLFPKSNTLQFELYELVDNHDVIQSLHDKYVNEGFEGLMARNLESLYKFKHRSNDLLKYKNFEDEEFEIVDFKLGKGTEEGAIIYTCKSGTEVFDVRPRGSIFQRIEDGKKGKSFIGKKLTVRYQKDSRDLENTLPRFPVGICIRDYE